MDFTWSQSVKEFAVTKQEYLQAHPNAGFDLVATSVLVVDTTTTSGPRILLLQRAATDSMPNRWEPPGGACDDEDTSILHGAARELWEEAGLHSAYFETVGGEPHVFKTSRGRTVGQYHFTAHIKTTTGTQPVVKLNPDEHQNFLWASEAEITARKSGGLSLEFTNEKIAAILIQALRRHSG